MAIMLLVLISIVVCLTVIRLLVPRIGRFNRNRVVCVLGEVLLWNLVRRLVIDRLFLPS